MHGETEALHWKGLARVGPKRRSVPRDLVGLTAVASGALSRPGPRRRPGTARLQRFTSKNKHVPQAAPVRRGPAPASTAAAGSKPALCPPRRPRGPGDFN